MSRLNGVYFNWITNEPSGLSYDRDRHIGLIAQEVQAVLPEAVSPVEDGKYLGVDYVSMIPVVIEAIRELDELWKEGKIDSVDKDKHMSVLFDQLNELAEKLSLKVESFEVQMSRANVQVDQMLHRLDEIQYW